MQKTDELTGLIPDQHDLDLDAQDTLSQFDVLDGLLYIVVDRVARVNHETVDELHGLGTLTSEFTRHDDLAALGARLHDEAEDTVAGSRNKEIDAFS